MFKLYLLFLVLSIAPNVDRLSLDKPDKFDLRLSAADLKIAKLKEKKEEEQIEQKSLEAEQNKEKLDNQVETLGKLLETSNLHSLNSKKLWKSIFDYIMLHINDFLKNNQLKFRIYMRYSFCAYIMPLLPTQYFLVFPSFYKSLIPGKFKKHEFVVKFLAIVDSFLEKVKKRSKKEMLPAFDFVRVGSSKEDLEIILEIPVLVMNDPLKIARWLFDFKMIESSLDKDTLAAIAN